MPLYRQTRDAIFFIQYKLSGELTSSGAKEWATWNRPYMRFKIPHSTKNAAEQFVDDYHQWDCLKALADKNYPTYYATNSTLQKSILQHHLSAGTLLNQVSLLDVRMIALRHQHVTFINGLSGFALHSEIEKLPKLMFDKMLRELSGGQQATFEEAVERPTNTAKELSSISEEMRGDLQRIFQILVEQIDRTDMWQRYIYLTQWFRKHSDVHLMWLPRGA